jgi:hypothetical protein
MRMVGAAGWAGAADCAAVPAAVAGWAAPVAGDCCAGMVAALVFAIRGAHNLSGPSQAVVYPWAMPIAIHASKNHTPFLNIPSPNDSTTDQPDCSATRFE